MVDGRINGRVTDVSFRYWFMLCWRQSSVDGGGSSCGKPSLEVALSGVCTACIPSRGTVQACLEPWECTATAGNQRGQGPCPQRTSGRLLEMSASPLLTVGVSFLVPGKENL